MNHLDNLVHDWGWWNRAYTRLLIRSRGYRLASMRRELPEVKSIDELAQHESALFPLETRVSLDNLRPPRVALGEHAAYVVDYYKREFPAREDRPFLAYFREPILYGRQFSMLDSRHRAFEECFTRDRRWREGVPKKKPKPRKVPGTFLLAGAEFHNHYAHLFCDVLPRLKLFEEAGIAGKYPAVLPPPSHGFAAEAWRTLGMDGAGSERFDDKCWQVDGLYFVTTYKKFCSWTPEAADWVRAKFSPRIETAPVGKKVLYISRRDGPRAILNEDEIVRALKPYDVTVVQTEKMTLQEQIDLFAEAGTIIGPHGAGIQNALWAPRGCRVLELVNARYFSGVYWTLAESLGQPYGLVAGASPHGGDSLKDGYTCDIELIRHAIDRL